MNPLSGSWFYRWAVLVGLAAGLAVLLALAQSKSGATGPLGAHQARPWRVRGPADESDARAGPTRDHDSSHHVPAGRAVRVRVRAIEGFPAFADALRMMNRTPGVARARAIRFQQGAGVFEVAPAAPTTREALTGMLSEALGRELSIEPEV